MPNKSTKKHLVALTALQWYVLRHAPDGRREDNLERKIERLDGVAGASAATWKSKKDAGSVVVEFEAGARTAEAEARVAAIVADHLKAAAERLADEAVDDCLEMKEHVDTWHPSKMIGDDRDDDERLLAESGARMMCALAALDEAALERVLAGREIDGGPVASPAFVKAWRLMLGTLGDAVLEDEGVKSLAERLKKTDAAFLPPKRDGDKVVFYADHLHDVPADADDDLLGRAWEKLQAAYSNVAASVRGVAGWAASDVVIEADRFGSGRDAVVNRKRQDKLFALDGISLSAAELDDLAGRRLIRVEFDVPKGREDEVLDAVAADETLRTMATTYPRWDRLASGNAAAAFQERLAASGPGLR
jgi:hypothetical protein